MPTTVGQLILVVLVVIPGLLWVVIRETRLPRWSRSPFRETAEFIAVSSVATIFGFLISLLLWTLWSDIDTASILADVAAYYGREPRLTAGLVLTGFGISAALAVAGAVLIQRIWNKNTARRSNVPIWHSVINRRKHAKERDRYGIKTTGGSPSTLVLCELEDGTRISGICTAFDDEPGSSGNRDLVLSAPTMSYPTSAVDKPQPSLLNYNSVVINERCIRWWGSRWLDAEATQRYVRAVTNQREKARRDDERTGT